MAGPQASRQLNPALPKNLEQTCIYCELNGHVIDVALSSINNVDVVTFTQKVTI